MLPLVHTVDAEAMPPDPDHPGIAALRSALWAVGYNADHVREVFGAEGESLVPNATQVALLRRRLEPGTSLTTLLSLFLLDLPVTREDAARALAPLGLDAAADMGVVRERDGAIRCGVRLHPYAGFIFACSPVPESRAANPDHVMGITRSTVTLANLTVRRPVDSALDLGSGTGVQALLASRHATRVVAVDLNPAACRFTAFNARLNRVDNVEVRQGSYFEPIGDEQFDLLVSNPPFVISPDNQFLYRDSDAQGDEVSRQVVAAAAAHLRPDGFATILVSWGRTANDDWAARPTAWAGGLGCDALVLHQATQSALAHSASWHAPLAGVDNLAYEAGIDRWTEHLAGLGFAAVGYGAVVLRRRDGENWLRTDETPGTDVGPAGEQLDRIFEVEARLRASSPEDILASRPVLVPDHRLEQLMRCRDGRFEVESAVLTLEDGLPFRATVDAFNAYLLSRLDGSRTVREAVADAAVLAPEGARPAEVEAAAARSVRRMLELGFLHDGQ